MKPSQREQGNVDFLTSPYVAIPYAWITDYAKLGLTSEQFAILLQILAATQVRRQDFLTPQELATLCGETPETISRRLQELVNGGYLAIGERLDEQGAQSCYYDFAPLWQRMRGHDPLRDTTREWRKNPVTLFEEEFGRPLSGLECQQLAHWLDDDGYPEWMLTEALREAVFANKYSFKYIDRVLYDWQKNRVRSRQDLEIYRENYRDRLRARSESAAALDKLPRRSRSTSATPAPHQNKEKDERYSAFYELFPDT